MTHDDKRRIYKILNAEDWAIAKHLCETKTALDEGDGYVHLSARDQVAETLQLHYAGQAGACLLEYIAGDLGPALRWEESRGGQLFPHLYGSLKISDAVRIWTLETDASGNPVLPQDIDA